MLEMKQLLNQVINTLTPKQKVGNDNSFKVTSNFFIWSLVRFTDEISDGVLAITLLACFSFTNVSNMVAWKKKRQCSTSTERKSSLKF